MSELELMPGTAREIVEFWDGLNLATVVSQPATFANCLLRYGCFTFRITDGLDVPIYVVREIMEALTRMFGDNPPAPTAIGFDGNSYYIRIPERHKGNGYTTYKLNLGDAL